MKLLTEAPVNGGPNYEGRALQGPSINPAVCGNTRASSPTPPEGEGKNGRGADYPQETDGERGRKAEWNQEDPQRLHAGETYAKTVHAPGYEI